MPCLEDGAEHCLASIRLNRHDRIWGCWLPDHQFRPLNRSYLELRSMRTPTRFASLRTPSFVTVIVTLGD